VCIESALNGCHVVGEDLGTVPETVRNAMSEHGAIRMYVSQFEVEPHRQPPLNPVPDDVVASVNTHDTPMFAGFWRHRDVVERVDRGILTEDEGQRDHAGRDAIRDAILRGLRQEGRLSAENEAEPSDVLVALLMRLAESPAPLVIVTLEDLWLEEAPQNVPGTSWQRPNWRRRMQVGLDRIEAQPQIEGLLKALAASRGD